MGFSSRCDQFRRALRHPVLVRNRIRRFVSGLKIDSMFGGGFSFLPTTVAVSPTLKCNLNCLTCGLKQNLQYPERMPEGTHFDREMTLPDMRLIARRLASFRPVILISGGEPLLVPDLSEFVRILVRDQHMYAGLLTNGHFLGEHAQALLNSGLCHIYLSVDGYGETHDSIRGAGAFQKLETSLVKFLSVCRSRRCDPPAITACITITPQNQLALLQTVEWLISLGLTRIHLKHMVSIPMELLSAHNSAVRDDFDRVHWTWGEGLRYEDINITALVEEIRRIKLRLKSVPGATCEITPDLDSRGYREYYLERKGRRADPCRMFWKTAFVYPDGNVMPSNICYFHPMGNIFSHSFEEIWNGDQYRFLRKRVIENGRLPVCDRCYCSHGLWS
ncbi:radical SAM protein [bacterium]|nr:radical SAM protein [candidate division CSSED10-310 bacterium]